ncbi:glycosyltransferase, partial [Streptomyces abikoensis]|uniref:glycosyltransferase n=1 Tax=Streptomyces abikoensis TaxID=97398 RepID=UPI0036A73493
MVVCAVSLALFWMAAFTLWWQMHAWRTPETLAGTRFQPAGDEGALSFSLLVPARHEQAVLEHTVTRLLESTHGRFEVLVIVGHDDPETAEVAGKVAAAAPDRVRVIVDTHEKKNKPKALNTALPHCLGEVVGGGGGARPRPRARAAPPPPPPPPPPAAAGGGGGGAPR